MVQCNPEIIQNLKKKLLLAAGSCGEQKLNGIEKKRGV
jgi:hypothetical protein